jgi:Secretion system C-terminal sorting domain
MKKLYFLVFSLLLLTGYSAKSQCLFTSAFGTATINPSGAVVTISTCSFAGEYSTINGAVNGQTLRFTSSVATDFITIRSGTSNGPVVAFGVTPLVFSNTFTGTLFAHWATSAACGSQAACRTTTVQCTNCTVSAPPNDLCTAALPIACAGSVTGTTVGATIDAVPTCVTTLNTAPGVWYTFVGTGQSVTLSTCPPGTAYDSKIGVFTGTCAALVCVTGNDDFCGLQSQVNFPTVLGTTYYVLVTGFGTATGAFTLRMTCAAAIPNDACTGALPIPCGGSVSGTTVGATIDAVPTCITTLNTAPGIWYTFVGNGATNTLSTCGGATWDTKIGVFTGTCAALVCVTGNDDFCGLQSQVVFPTTLGTTYYVLLTGFGAATGAFTLTRTSAALPNDLCTGAININCGQTITGSTACGATIDAVGTCGTALGTAPGVWYQFMGDGSAVTLSLCGSSYDTKIGVFRGTCAGLICVTGNDDFCGLQSQVTFTSLAGAVHYILVTGFGTATGNFTLTRTCAPACVGVPSPGSVTPVTSTVCVGSSVTLTCSGYPNNTGLTFQWSSAPAAAGPYTNIAGATGNIYTFNAPAATTYYRCTVTCTSAGGGSSTTAPPVVVNVSNILFTSATATPSTVCAPGSVVVSATVTGGTNLGNYSYTLVGPGTIGAPVFSGPNNSSVSYNVTNIPFGSYVFILTASDPVPCSKTTYLGVTVNPPGAITIAPPAPVICQGAIQPLTASVNIPRFYNMTTSTGNAIVPGTTLVPLTQGDDLTATVTLPFTYSAYDVPYTQVNVSTNGNIQFTTNSTTFTNVCPLPASIMGVAFHPHWDDLHTGRNAAEGIYTSVSGSAPNRIFNIEWRAEYFTPATNAVVVNFQARIYEGQQRIDFIYGNVQNNGVSASIGIQSFPTSQATTFSCNAGGLSSGLGISYVLPPPPPPPLNVTFSPLTELFTDAGATTAYTGTPLTTVYARPSVTRTYTASYTTPQGCTSSTNVTVTVNQLPAITVQPSPATQTICPGFNVTYTVGATGTGLTYQWRRNGVNLVEGPQLNLSTITGSTTNTLTITNLGAANAGTYDVVVSGVCPPPVTSVGVVLNVGSAPTITTQPTNQSMCSIVSLPPVLLNNNTATFSVVTTGVPPPTFFQWQISTTGPGGPWSNLSNTLSTASPSYSGTFTTSLTIGNAPVSLNGSLYRLIITNICGQSVTSNAATLTVNASPVVNASDLFSQRICISDTLVPLSGSPVGGSWSGIGVSGFNFVPPATAIGTYVLTYTYTNPAGCTVRDTTSVKVIDCPERLRRLTDPGALTIFPNPSNGQFNVRLNSTLYNYLGLKVYNMQGQLMNGSLVKDQTTKRYTLVSPVYSGLVYGRTIPINLSHLASGTYLVVFYYDDGVRTSKQGFNIVIQR